MFADKVVVSKKKIAKKMASIETVDNPVLPTFFQSLASP